MFWFNKKRKYLDELEIISHQLNGEVNPFNKILERIDNVTLLLQKLNEKIDTLIENLEKRSRISPVEKKRKEEILSILKENKGLSVYKLSGLIGLSRTRCNELLKSLENEGMVESIRVGRRKIYRITTSVNL
jgi:predicted transcriptional regulator